MIFFAVLTALVLTGFLNRWLINKVNDQFWGKKYLKLSAKYFPFILPVFIILFFLGNVTKVKLVLAIGSVGSAIFFLLNIFLLMAFAISYLFAKWDKKSTPKPVDEKRRDILKYAAASVPALATVTVAGGIARSFSDTAFPQIKMYYPNLPKELEGFKILHLSDLHLGYYFGLDHLEKTLLDAEKYNVDMLVATGDIADDLRIMTDATKLMDQLKTPSPKYVSIGNHEYFRGIKQAIKEIEKGPVPLLLNKHESFMVGTKKVIVGGADDPVRLNADMYTFFDHSLAKIYHNAPQADFNLLLSHRPRALNLAEKYKVDLTLSGHTHGGQVGFAGRSIWEIFNREGYLWGKYNKGQYQLYTSAGMGHWFPYRLNCPLEAPVITLHRSV